MFETLVTGLLTSALGSYIEPKCFSSDKINVAVWSGYVVLTELEVKPEVVAELPAVRLVRGLVGSIELKIPWNRLQSDSVVATVDDVYLLLRTEEDIDAVMRRMDEFTLKKKLLEELYTQAKRQEETADADGAANAASEDGFAARLVNKIIDNLELHIRRIHIRIEDHSSGDHPFAMGLTIESVHVQSTNSNWQPSYVDAAKNNEPRIFKIVELNHLSVYCNPDCELQRDRQIDFERCSAEEFSSAFSRAIPKRFDDRHYHHMQLYPSQQQHHFLLKPIDASARLIVNRDVFDANVPKFEIDVNISEVAFRLEESQYCDMLYLASALQIPDHYTKYQRYRKFRPQATVFDDPVKWWRYAITAVLKDQQAKKQQWTWGFMKDRREDRKRYVSLWQQKSRQLLELADVDYVYSDSEDNDDVENNGSTAEDDEQGTKAAPLDHPNLQKLSSFEIDGGLEEIERRRSVEDVLFFRYLADLDVRKFQATRAARVRRRLPTPPTHKSQAFSDTDSVDTDFTESSVPAEMENLDKLRIELFLR
ncbi:Vacuolar protein sorting-associated protein [Phytophthora cinnamomi]|uniref:Vacuolar protein sorting-associated protein n=1 Tax=Phytophthora cinnamomi TaxID=4785 RepID=UPI00355ABFD4|nr:Vacuolar protein sorting-associated protein [Phytophthora cinnamomi]